MYKPTGTNVTPLGTKRRFVEAPSEKQEDYKEKSTQSESPPTPNSSASDLTPKRKRKSRWGDEQKIIIPGLPTAVNKLDKQQSEKYLCKSQISM
ncbi:hypothetical protein G6F68_020120 [Rhizopus microsporus]|nr:hypothetical protein G6F68_020120 [Rhizopus microsporus]